MTYFYGDTLHEVFSKAFGKGRNVNKVGKQQITSREQLRQRDAARRQRLQRQLERDREVNRCRRFWKQYALLQSRVDRLEEQFGDLVRRTDPIFEEIREHQRWFARQDWDDKPPPEWTRRAIEVGDQGSGLAGAIAVLGLIGQAPTLFPTLFRNVVALRRVREGVRLINALRAIDRGLDATLQELSRERRFLADKTRKSDFQRCQGIGEDVL